MTRDTASRSILAIAITVISLSTAAVATAQTGKILAVPSVSQLPQTNWCWAASSQAVLSFTGNAPGMCSVADWARQRNGWGNDNCCTNPTGAICNQPNNLFGGSGGSVQNILEHWGADSSSYYRSLSLSEVQDAIDADSPIMVRWGWTTGGGHLVVLHGYSGTTMSIMDPWNGPTLLSHANVTSTSARTWTHSLLVGPKRVTYVVDDTGSMGDEIASVRASLISQVDNFVSAGRFVKYTLITYKDAPTVVGTTTNPTQVKSWINALVASGGGDCPEEGYGALDKAADVAPGSDIWWMTDADSHGGVLRMLQTRVRLFLAGNTLHSTILGSCGATGGDVSAFEAGESLSGGTGGLFLPVTSSVIAPATSIVLNEMLSNSRIQATQLTAGGHSLDIPVDGSVTSLKVTLTASLGVTASVVLQNPDGVTLASGMPGVTQIVAGQSRMLRIDPPALVPGVYLATTTATGVHDLTVSGASPYGLRLLGDTTTGVGEALSLQAEISRLNPPTAPGGPGPDGPGGPLPPFTVAPAIRPFDVSHFTFYEEREDGTNRHPLGLFDDGAHADRQPGDGTFGGLVTFASEGYHRIGVTDGGLFQRVARLFVASSVVSVTATPPAVAAPGSTLAHTFTIKNVGTTAHTYDIAASSTAGWSRINVVPRSIALGAGATDTIDVQVVIPVSAANSDTDALTLVVVAQDAPGVTDSSTTTTMAWQGVLLSSLQPGTVTPGTVLTLTGTFGADPGAGNRSTDGFNVSLAGHRVPDSAILDWSPATIHLTVPTDAATGLVQVVSGGVPSNTLELIVIAITMTGDIDRDGDVDLDDVNLVIAARNTIAAPSDPRDLDHDGRITALDARQVTLLCTRPRCATH
jgi:hypothetical protein